MAKKIKKYQNPSGSLQVGPAENAKIRRVEFSPLPTMSQSDVVHAALVKEQKRALSTKDPGLAPITTYPSTKSPSTKSSSTFGGSVNTESNISGSVGNVSSIIGAANDFGSQFIDQDPTKNPTGYQAQQAIGDALLKSGNPYAMAAGAAFKTVSSIAEATGGNTSTITKDQASDLGIGKGEKFLNNALGILLPGAGWGVSKTVEGQKSHVIDEMSNAYADSVGDINRSTAMGGGKYIFGQDTIQSSILSANRKNELLTNINLTNKMRKQSNYGQDLAQQNINRYAGTNYMDMRVGKQGMKFPELDDIREMLKNRTIPEENIQKFADGGSILPQGKLHKELNHITEINSDLGDLTRKGIPVVTLNEGGEIEQVAEIERDEWTLSKEFTDRIEALWKDGSEEAMIECGKLVCEELLRNTQDSSNILEKEEKDE